MCGPGFPQQVHATQIHLHDIGGVWIFLAACIGLGAVWNAALLAAPAGGREALGGRSGPEAAAAAAAGRPEGLGALASASGEGSAMMGATATNDESVRLAWARMIQVRAAMHGFCCHGQGCHGFYCHANMTVVVLTQL